MQVQNTIDSLETDAASIEHNIHKMLKKKSIRDEDLLDLLSQAENEAHRLVSVLGDCSIAAEEL